MKGYDIVMDGTTIKLNGLSTRCIAEAGCHGVNLNGFGEENDSHSIFVQNGKTCLPGFGMTPGVTQMMAMHAKKSARYGRVSSCKSWFISSNRFFCIYYRDNDI